MQTFLPYADFRESLKCLDTVRLRKQRVEAFQILRILCGEIGPNPETGRIGWATHPATLMWAGWEDALTLYYNLALELYSERPKKDGTMSQNILLKPREENPSPAMPDWFGNEDLHSSHRSRLLLAEYNFYEKYGWQDDISAPLWWPTTIGEIREGKSSHQGACDFVKNLLLIYQRQKHEKDNLTT